MFHMFHTFHFTFNFNHLVNGTCVELVEHVGGFSQPKSARVMRAAPARNRPRQQQSFNSTRRKPDHEPYSYAPPVER